MCGIYVSFLKHVRADQFLSKICRFSATMAYATMVVDIRESWEPLEAACLLGLRQEIDKDSSAVLATFKKWADDNFGGTGLRV